MVRGELWWADLGLPRGSAPALRRPVLIVSSDQYNRSELRTVTVAVVTSNIRLAALPGNVAVSSDLAGLEADSVVNVTQVATVDRGALEQRIGVLPDWSMAQVDAGLERALALGRAR
jgi:mRNA interferase MazF